MHQAFGRFSVVFLVLLFALACGGPMGPSGINFGGTVTVDGQTFQFTNAGNASSGFRRPPNPAWPRGLLDISLATCGSEPSLIMAIYDRNPSPGRYEVSGEFVDEGVTAAWVGPSGDKWGATGSKRGSSGSVTVSSISAARVSGSFSFTMVQHIIGEFRPPLPTKLVEGTFDLEIEDRVTCP